MHLDKHHISQNKPTSFLDHDFSFFYLLQQQSEELVLENSVLKFFNEFDQAKRNAIEELEKAKQYKISIVGKLTQVENNLFNRYKNNVIVVGFDIQNYDTHKGREFQQIHEAEFIISDFVKLITSYNPHIFNPTTYETERQEKFARVLNSIIKATYKDRTQDPNYEEKFI